MSITKTMIVCALAITVLVTSCVTETTTGADTALKAQLKDNPFLITGFDGDKSHMGIALGDRVSTAYGSLLLFGQRWTLAQQDEASPKMMPLNWTVFEPAEAGYKYDAVGCMTVGGSLYAFELRVPEDPQNGTLAFRIYGGTKGGVRFETPVALMSKIASGAYPLVGTFSGTLGKRDIARHLLQQRPLRLTLLPALVGKDDWLALLRQKSDAYFDNLETLLKEDPGGNRNTALAMALPALAEASSKERARTYLAKATKDSSQRVRNAAILPYCERIKPDGRLLKGLESLADDRDPSVRKRVVYILSKHDVGIPIMIQRLADRNKDVRELAFVRLDRIDRPIAQAEIEALGKLAGQSPRVLARLSALKLLAKAPASQANVWIIPALGDVDSDVREAALKVLETRQFAEADLASLQALTKHVRRSVRKHTVPLLNTIDASGATLSLIELMADSHGDVRAAAFKAVSGRRPGADYIDPLSTALNAPPSATRIYAAELLGNVDDERVAPILTKRLERENHSQVRRAIILALNKRIGTKQPKPTP